MKTGKSRKTSNYRTAPYALLVFAAASICLAVPACNAGLEITTLGLLQLDKRDDSRGTENKYRSFLAEFEVNPSAVAIKQTACSLGGNTSVRNQSPLVWKTKGYFMRARDIGQVFTTGGRNLELDAIILRTGPSHLAFLGGAAGAKIVIQFFEVHGHPEIDDNGTPQGSNATHGFSSNHRCDDIITGVEYAPIHVVRGGIMPDLREAGNDGRLVYFKLDFTGDDEITFEANTRYAFMVGIEEAGNDANFTLANKNTASSPAPPRMTDAGMYPGGWGLRREGRGTKPHKVPGDSPPEDPSLLARLQRESMFGPLEERLKLPPTTDGYPDVDTYRDLEFYILNLDAHIQSGCPDVEIRYTQDL